MKAVPAGAPCNTHCTCAIYYFGFCLSFLSFKREQRVILNTIETYISGSFLLAGTVV